MILRVKRKNPLWLPRFIRNTKYNENTLEEQAYKGATVGLSRMKYLATQHYSPLEALSILEFETENGIDDLFVPLALHLLNLVMENKKMVDQKQVIQIVVNLLEITKIATNKIDIRKKGVKLNF